MKLAELQQAFAADILAPDTTVAPLIVEDDKGSAAQRLFIYQHAYNARLQEALQTDYPGLYAYLGEAEFSRMALAYSRAYPSQNPSLRWFGQNMAQFLRTHYPDYPILSEMAAFEWALGESFDALDQDVLGLQDLQQIAPEHWGDLQISFAPSLRLLDLYWNVPQIWQALDQQQTPPEAQRGDYPVRWMVWRHGLAPHWRSLPVDEAWAIAELQAGTDIAELCAGLTEWIDEAHIPQRLLELLRGWLTASLVTGLHPRLS
ncbi:MAG: putative DNA-binding domain-containing protein [Candidatus Competibacteraceae bacterium]|nr:putative DNA-binding domain-containing protein [Candidatus Competibacteraceae bacterium]